MRRRWIPWIALGLLLLQVQALGCWEFSESYIITEEELAQLEAIFLHLQQEQERLQNEVDEWKRAFESLESEWKQQNEACRQWEDSYRKAYEFSKQLEQEVKGLKRQRLVLGIALAGAIGGVLLLRR